MANDTTAHAIWTSLDGFFRYNKESHAIYLEAEFRNLMQEDMLVPDYCCKIKKLVDALGDVDQAVSDKTLILNTLRGLNEKFLHMWTLLPMQKPFPTFIEARSYLLLEEVKQAQLTKTTQSTALIATAPSSASNKTGGNNFSYSGNNYNNRHHNNRNNGSNTFNNTGSCRNTSSPWSSFFNSSPRLHRPTASSPHSNLRCVSFTVSGRQTNRLTWF